MCLNLSLIFVYVMLMFDKIADEIIDLDVIKK